MGQLTNWKLPEPSMHMGLAATKLNPYRKQVYGIEVVQTHHLGHAATLLEDGGMKEIKIGDQVIVLARRGDEYYAFDAHCTHYGAPLQDGVLSGHKLICPWHHACFDIRTGFRQEPPALDSIATYPVTIEDGQVMIELKPEAQPIAEGIKQDKTYIIVGGGAAGEAAAEELRRAGFAGKLILLSASSMLPVDRPNLSKEYLAGEAEADWIPLRDQSWYKDKQIDLHLETRVIDMDAAARKLKTDGGDTFRYDKVLLASGSQPRTLEGMSDDSFENVLTLRQKADADEIIDNVQQDAQIVIIGTSFIGMEVAASLGKRGANVTVVGLEHVPFEGVFGKEVGQFLQRLHQENGIRFQLQSEVEQFDSENGQVTHVEVADGTRLPADVVIIGVGVEPVTEYLTGSGIAVNQDDQSIVVDQYLQTSVPNVYAAGDIARFPANGHGTMRIEHWRAAQQHGFVAAHNMLDLQDSIHDHVPFFWTSQWGTRLRYVGHSEDWDSIVYRDTVDDGEFIAFYLADNKLQAALGVGYDAEMAALEHLLLNDLPLSPQEMKNTDFDIVAHASAAQEESS